METTREIKLTAQPTATVPASKFGDFKAVQGSTGATLYLLVQKANQSDSMDFLDRAGLVPYTHQEILPLLMKDETLKNLLKGKWFYLAGKGLEEDGIYTIDEKGELAQIGDREISTESKVRAWKGPYPLSLYVSSDLNAALYGRRFGLYVDGGPHDVAPVVVGKPKPKLEAQAPKAASMLRAEKDKTVVITSPVGERTEIRVAEGTTIELE